MLSIANSLSVSDAEKELASLSWVLGFWFTGGSIVSGFLGGYVCARMSRRSEMELGFSLAASVAVLGAGLGLADLSANSGVPSITFVVVALLLGALVGAKQNRES